MWKLCNSKEKFSLFLRRSIFYNNKVPFTYPVKEWRKTLKKKRIIFAPNILFGENKIGNFKNLSLTPNAPVSKFNDEI